MNQFKFVSFYFHKVSYVYLHTFLIFYQNTFLFLFSLKQKEDGKPSELKQENAASNSSSNFLNISENTSQLNPNLRSKSLDLPSTEPINNSVSTCYDLIPDENSLTKNFKLTNFLDSISNDNQSVTNHDLLSVSNINTVQNDPSESKTQGICEDDVNKKCENKKDFKFYFKKHGDNVEDKESEDANLKKERAILKRNYALQELVETEKDYVKDLSLIVDGYIELMKKEDIPEDLKSGKDKMIFGNISNIYEWHREYVLN